MIKAQSIAGVSMPNFPVVVFASIYLVATLFVPWYTQLVPEPIITSIFGASFLVALGGAIMPGPLLALTIGEAAHRGFWAGPLLIFGHGILELMLVIGLVLGLSRFAEAELVSSVIGMVGGIVLIGMGLTAIRKGWHQATIPAPNLKVTSQNRMLVLSGVIVSVCNPYWFIWWGTIGLTYLLWSLGLGVAGVASFFTGHILGDLSWYALVAFIIATGKKALSDAVYRWLVFTCGFALVALGSYFIVSGVEFLIG